MPKWHIRGVLYIMKRKFDLRRLQVTKSEALPKSENPGNEVESQRGSRCLSKHVECCIPFIESDAIVVMKPFQTKSSSFVSLLNDVPQKITGYVKCKQRVRCVSR